MGQALARRGFAPRPSTEGERLHRLGGLLARWHCWRRGYTTERGYALKRPPTDPEDALELMLMRSIEQEVSELPLHWQRLVQQLARAECLGVEVDADTSAPEYAAVLDHVGARLRAIGIL